MSREVQMLSLGCTVHMFLVSASVEQCGVVVVAQVKSGEGIHEETGGVAACSVAHCCLPAGVCYPHSSDALLAEPDLQVISIFT